MRWVLGIVCLLLAGVAEGEPRLYEGELAFQTKDVAPVRALLLGDRVVVQLGETDLASVDPAHNRILWRERPGGAIVHMEARGADVLAQADDLRVFSGADGTLRWVYPLTDQRLLHLGADVAVVAGFGPDPRQIAVLSLSDGALRWPQWAQVPGAASATVDAERIYVKTPDGRIVPVDLSTGRVRDAVAEAPAPPATPVFTTTPVAGRLLVLGPEVAAWVPAEDAPTRIERDGKHLLVVGPRGVRVMAGTPLVDRAAGCRAKIASADQGCLADLAPLIGRLDGADAAIAPVMLAAALGTDAVPKPTAERLGRVRALLPELERVSPGARAPLLARVAQLVAPLVDGDRMDDASELLSSLEALATEGPNLTELRLGVSAAAAVGRLSAARRAYKARDDEGALAELDVLAALPGLAALLPMEIVDARDGRKELRAALDAVGAVLPSSASSAKNPSLCQGACMAARDACPGGDATCAGRAGACFGRCPSR